MLSDRRPRSTAPGSAPGRAIVIVAVLAVLALLAGCTNDAHTDDTASARAESAVRQDSPTQGSAPQPPSSVFPEGWTPTTLHWRPCEVDDRMQCAQLTVPLDWDRPHGRTIELALARTTATGQRIGSLLTNPGGPGASGIEFLSYSPFGRAITDRFDVVSWDPRGVGASTSLSCGTGVDDFLELDPEPDSTQEQQQLDRAAREVSRECGSTDGDLLPHVGTADVARDMEAIRRALGDEPLNYVGFSYGTQIGQVYADMFPEHIRSMVLDAVVDPAQSYEQVLIDQAVAFERSFERNARACAAAGPDRCGVDDLGAAYDRVAERVERHPLGSGDTLVGPSELSTGAIFTSYGFDGWSRLGPALERALDGDGSELRHLADSYRDFGGYTAYAAVVCIDTPPPRGDDEYAAFAERAAKAAPRFGAAVANELLPCATWPVDPVGEPEEIVARGAPPMLVIGNTGDAATPYENAVAVSKRLASGVLITADIDGHGGYGSDECVTTHVDAYLLRLQVPKSDPRCT